MNKEKRHLVAVPVEPTYTLAETLSFILPETLEETLWALPVLAQYLQNRMMRKRITVNIFVVSKLLFLFPTLHSFFPLATLCTELPEDAKQKSDFIFDFDADKAYIVTQSVMRHISEAYGVVLGAYPMAALPPIALPNLPEEVASVLFIERSKWDKELPEQLWEYQQEFLRIGEEAGIAVSVLPADASWDEMLERIAKASVVVGIRSSGTLVAAAALKIVMELTPESWGHRNWMAKWESSKCRCMFRDLDRVEPNDVWIRTQNLVEDTIAKQRSSWGTPLTALISTTTPTATIPSDSETAVAS